MSFRDDFNRGKCGGTSEVLWWVILEAGSKITKSSLTRFQCNPCNNKASADNLRDLVGSKPNSLRDNSGVLAL